jgi:hypothetical protein
MMQAVMKHQELPLDPEEFSTYVENLTSTYEQEQVKLQRQYNELKEKYEILRRAFFGRSSEKLSAEESKQASLFNEAEVCADREQPEAQEPVVEAVANRRRRSPVLNPRIF